MAVTPQTNTTLAAIAEELSRRDDFVICGHVSPDGDCIGSQLALMHALRSLGKTATCVYAEADPSVDEAFSFLPGFDEIVPAPAFDGPIGVFVGVDVPTVGRIGDAAALHAAAPFAVTIDHHAVDTTMADLVYVDPDAAASAMLVWELAGYLMPQRDEKVALCAFTGLSTDTGRFQFQSTTAQVFDTAAQMVAAGADPALSAREVYQNRRFASVQLESRVIERVRLQCEGQVALSWLARSDFEEFGATKADAEPMIDILRSIRGVRVACMLREQGDAVRGSFRAKDDTDVGTLARDLGGGGHRAAAGFTLEMPLDRAIEKVTAELERLVAPKGGAAR